MSISVGWGIVVGLGIWKANPFGGTWKGAIGHSIVGVTLTRPAVLNKIIQPVVTTVAKDVWHLTKAFAGTTTGSVTIGYAAGAAIGTGIVTKEFGWDPEGETMGGKDVLSFYTFGATGDKEHKPTLPKILTAYEYAPQTAPGKYLQYFPNITWLWGRENIAYI